MSALLTRPGRIELFSHGRQFELTPRVAGVAGVSEAAAREWASRHRVQRTARAYLWTRHDVEGLLRDLAAPQTPPPGGNEAA